MLEDLLIPLIAEKQRLDTPLPVLLNFIKEYIQYLALNFIYNHPKYKKLVFKGGSCLRICYGLPRLSEDLDFDCDKRLYTNLLESLDEYLQKEIKEKYFSALETKLQSTVRLYLKFPFLHSLGMAKGQESDKLYVKIEAENNLIPQAQFEITPISQYGYNFLAYHYDLPTLMAGKIHAVLFRLWFKGKKQEVDIKGRDFYDLYWFLKNGVKPNYKALKMTVEIKNEKELKKILAERIKKSITSQKLKYDLQNFIPDYEFVDGFSQNYAEIIGKYL